METFVTHSLRGEDFDASEDGTGRGTPLVPVEIVATLDASFSRLQGCSGQDANHGHSHLVAFSAGDSGQDIGFDICPTIRKGGEGGGNQPAVAFAIQERAVSENLDNGPQGKGFQPDVAYTLEARNKVQVVAFDLRGREGGAQFEGPHDTCNIRAASGGSSRSYVASTGVRRLLPVECERLQGFPDHFTAIPYRTRSVTDDEAQLAAIEGRVVWQDGDRLVTDCMADGPRYKALGNSMPVNVIRHYLQRVEQEVSDGPRA